MSDYTLAVSWSGKDALADSDAAKVISGADFNTEFTTVRTAVNSKADLNGDAGESFAIDDATVAGTLAVTGNTTVGGTLAVTGVPTIPTAATATNTTQAASTAFVHAAIDADVVTHAALRSSETVYGHPKIHVSGGTLYIVTT
jgi:hypothetical protein